MLTTITTQDVKNIICATFSPCTETERVALCQVTGRTLAEDVAAGEYVPAFHRSTVDGYALRAADTFGCSEAMPAILHKTGEVHMGRGAEDTVGPGECVAVPTGGAVPEGADAVVMVEYSEEYGQSDIGIVKPAAPGSNMIFKGDDVDPGKRVLLKGRRLNPQDIGALAAMGIDPVPVRERLKIGVISTGDELVEVSEIPGPGQIRDVNSTMLSAMIMDMGATPVLYGIIRDQEQALSAALEQAVEACHMVLISGGSSVGVKDATRRVLEQVGTLLFHGISMKPGKPTLLAKVREKPVFGLPGNPVAASFVTQLFVRTAVDCLTGEKTMPQRVRAILTQRMESNHGREQYCGVQLREENGRLSAAPIRGKSGLITSLAGADGYFCIPRDCEGLERGSEIEVFLY